MNSVKILFLDFDGVLNTPDWTWKLLDSGKLSSDAIDPEKVALLNQILDKTGAKVVVTSTWRCNPSFFTHHLLQSHLNKFGFRGEVIGVTEDNDYSRLKQIVDWLSNNVDPFSVTNYLILDDDDVRDPNDSRMHLVDKNKGLTEMDVAFAITKLNRLDTK